MIDHAQYFFSNANSGEKLSLANWEHTECHVLSTAANFASAQESDAPSQGGICAHSSYQCEYHSNISRRCLALLERPGSRARRRANANIRHPWNPENMHRDHAIRQRPVDG